ncbi:hypothetical protein CDL12_09220 [Handroanthus impetiginosus]|uniref:Uncharacterized protein n=1 Tax=Handroanthus impetiginosus TaxID=429701 RepID=A0A2G9HLE5_9LAMI|nr:hypothetical protein CDL12_09220 [Handroanthus impetiginosus]
MMKAAIIYKLFFIGFLLMSSLNLSNQISLPRYDRRLGKEQPSPPAPKVSEGPHVHH